jgi:hypothetical protein
MIFSINWHQTRWRVFMKGKWEIPIKVKSELKAVKELRSRFGTARTLQHVVFRLVNKVICFDCLHIIILDRENLKSLDPVKTQRLSTKIATLEDIKEMEKQGCWDLPKGAIEYFNRGDSCLLSYVDKKLAGYTWALKDEYPTLIPGLTISIPREYLYNFCGFTHPDFRGYGLQSYRHYELLNKKQWKNKKGLLGFVVYTNRSSRKGQVKGGYELIGKIYVIGRKSHVLAIIGKKLRNRGIKRINRLSVEK